MRSEARRGHEDQSVHEAHYRVHWCIRVVSECLRSYNARYIMLKSDYELNYLVLISVRTEQNFQARALGDFHDRVSSAARAWGHEFSSEDMHVYMGEIRFSLWSYHIDTVFKSIQLSCDICRVSNHHLVHDIHQMVGGLHNLYKFQWSITSCLSYVEYWPENIKTCLPPCGG